MKVYTKTGDGGETSLFDGARVKKSNDVIELLGSLDELNAHLGLVHSVVDAKLQLHLLQIIKNIFKLSANIALAKKYQCFDLTDEVCQLEQLIDELDSKLPKLKNFIYPVGSVAIGQVHIARAVCRRVERDLVALSLKQQINPSYLKYINRLSDLLFMLTRYIALQNDITEVVVEL